MQPLLNNYFTGGETWREPGVTEERVIARNQLIGAAAPALWAYAEGLIHDAEHARVSYAQRTQTHGDPRPRFGVLPSPTA